MSHETSEGKTINYKWNLENTSIDQYESLSSEWFTLENYDKIYFSMSLLKTTSNYYCLKVHKKSILTPEIVNITIHSPYDNWKKEVHDWKDGDDVKFEFSNHHRQKFLRCEIHLNTIDFEMNDYRILSKTSSIYMDKYLLSPQYSDVTIKIEDNEEELPAHKMVLAFHSSVFEAMFNSDMKEAKENCFYFGEFDIATVKEVLRFMYTGKIAQDDVDLLFKILACANMYQIEKLKIHCEYKLILNMNIDNIIQILVTIEELELPKLKEKAKLYLECNSKHISLVDAMNERNNSKILFEVLKKVSGMKLN